MSILSKIKTGQIGRAQKVVIYAPEGLGKSTLASKFPNPLFLDVEDSTSQLDVARLNSADIPDLKTFEATVMEVSKHNQRGSTLVVDTIDWLEAMAAKEICDEDKASNLEAVGRGYGQGYNMLTNRMLVTLTKLDAVISAGIHVVLLAHSSIVRFDPPDGAGAFDRYELKLYKDRKGGKGTASVIKEWADMVIFGNYRTQIEEKGKGDAVTYKGKGGKERVMYCNRSSAFDAKNRHGMPDVEKWDNAVAVLEKAFVGVGASWGESVTGAAKSTPAVPKTVEKKPSEPKSAKPEVKPEPVAPAPAPNADDEIPMDFRAAGEPEAVTEVIKELNADPLDFVCLPHVAAVEAYLIRANEIRAGQTWRDMQAPLRKRVLANPAGFLKAAGVKA